MSEVQNHLFDTIDRQNAHASAHTRRTLVKSTAAALGSMGLLGYASQDAFAAIKTDPANSVANITTVAATAEVLATIVNTVGPEKVNLDAQTKINVQTAAYEELIHYETLLSLGATPATKRIWVPDAVFASKESLLTTLVVGDQIFINAYLLGVTVFGRIGTPKNSQLARYSAEIMGVEGVHRALALQSLGRVGNDRAFMRFAGREEAPGLPTTGQPGFYDITKAPAALQAAGFGFGAEGAKPGSFYEYDDVSKRTPKPEVVNSRKPV